MFAIALSIGLYSYLLFVLGISGLFYKNVILLFSCIYLGTLIFIFRARIDQIKLINLNKFNNISKILFGLLIIQALVNLIGVLGPELSFDALWYHLTLPKIFIASHKIFHIPGNLFYYSDMPKNIEMIYAVGLSLGSEIFAKLTHYLFGFLSLVCLYKFSRKFIDENLSIIVISIFYSSLVIGWESISAYIDLGTVFFTLVSIYLFWEWIESGKFKSLVKASIITGFTIATKVVALNLIPIYAILIITWGIKNKTKYLNIIYQLFEFCTISIFVSLPWFMFSFFNTGNPFYPLLDKNIAIINKINFVGIVNAFLYSNDPINPIYAIFIPIVILLYKHLNFKIKILLIFFILSIFFWAIDSQIGGTRFLIPYLAVFSVIIGISINLIKYKPLNKFLIILIIIFLTVSIIYRFVANAKFIPVVFGTETKKEFLSKHLNFNFGDFYDTDGYFKNHIKLTDTVLLYGFHNLYYVDFPFIDSSFVKKGDKFNFVALQNVTLPQRFRNFKKIYYNILTKVSVYSDGGKIWHY